MMRPDPFSIKRLSKAHPRRLAFTLVARVQEKLSKLRFTSCELPGLQLADLPQVPEIEWSNTSVTRLQMQYILAGLNDTEKLGGPVVEIGSYRGATTKCMALATSRDIICVDPFIGYGGVDNDLRIFQKQVGDLTNVKHLRMTSGSARRNFPPNSTSFVFIDAVHDYVNTTFDIEAWWPTLVRGGILALHDTDSTEFPGTRRAVFEHINGELSTYAHPPNLVMIRKDGST
jgi:hypothetical protein